MPGYFDNLTNPATADTRTPNVINRTPAELLEIAIDANRPVLLMGAPGTAKTATIEAIAAARGAYLEVVIASAQDPTTILGIPMPTEDRKYTEPTMPGWARRINDEAAKGRPTILFLDELTTVPPMVAAPLLGVVQSRRSDGWTLPADTRIVAAANPPDLAVGGWALEPAMANRWVHIEWGTPVAAWCSWAAAQASPALQLLAEYIEAVPTELLAVPTNLKARSGAWASPRSWTNAAALVDMAGGDWSLAAYAVGEAAARTVAQWAAQRDVPSVAAILAGTADLPTRRDAWVQCIESLAAAATDETLARTFDVLTAAIPTDAATVKVAVMSMAARHLIAGIAPVIEAIEATGISFD